MNAATIPVIKPGETLSYAVCGLIFGSVRLSRFVAAGRTRVRLYDAGARTHSDEGFCNSV